MEKKENYRYTDDGVLLVRKIESGRTSGIGAMLENRELWYRCCEKDPDSQYLKVVLSGWFGFHKFLEGSWLQGIFYLLTCGCFGVFYFCDLLALFCGNYFYKEVTYMDEGQGIERRMQKIYYVPLENRKRAVWLTLLAVGILIVAICFVYQPIGNGLIGWITDTVSGQVTEETADKILQLIK